MIGIGAPHHAARRAARDSGRALQDFAELNWIGRTTQGSLNMVFMWKTSPVQTIADALKTESTLSAHRRGLHRHDLSHRAEQRDRHQVQAGHGATRARTKAMLAVERGEVEEPLHRLDGAEGGASRLGAGQDGLDPGSVFLLKRHPELPDVPDRRVDLARNNEERAILSAIMNAAEVDTAFFTTPGAAGGSRDDAAARLRRHDEGSRTALRGGTHEGRHLTADGRGGCRSSSADASAISPLPSWTRCASPIPPEARRIDGCVQRAERKAASGAAAGTAFGSGVADDSALFPLYKPALIPRPSFRGRERSGGIHATATDGEYGFRARRYAASK